MRTILDFESRSPVDLRKRGVYVYAADPRTEILCCAVKRHGQPTLLWFPKLWAMGHRTLPGTTTRLIGDDEFLTLVTTAEILAAHNAQFERVMWHFIMNRRLGFGAQPINRWQCSAARAAAQALPRKLEQVGSALHLPVQKDIEGHNLMLKMSKPRKDGTYLEDEESLIRLGKYCVTDAEVEELVEDTLLPLPASEELIYQLDQKINDRGIAYDAPGVAALKREIAKSEEKLLAEVSELTGGTVTSTRQRDKTLEWLEEEGVEMDDMRKNTVVSTLDELPEGKARRMLEIRQSLSLSSIKKLDAMQRLGSADNRIRGSLLYHGADTGRWAGRGLQPQNLPRDSYKEPEEVDAVIFGDAEIEAAFEKKPFCMMKAASRCLRGMLVAKPGHILSAIDFSAIEARVLAWLAQERHVLEGFRNNLDMYKVAASAIYNCGYDDVTKDQRQVGKVGELALGYQGWVGAFRTMAPTYGVDLTAGLRCPEGMTHDEFADELAKDIIIPWRENRPATVALWAGTNDAMIKAVQTGNPYRYGKLVFGVRGKFLYMKLPSGRMLAYPEPLVVRRKTKYGQEKDNVSYMGINSVTRRWERIYTYGGKAIENADQALSRDLLAAKMLQIEDEEIPIVFHAHDEAVTETINSVLARLMEIFVQPEPWCLDLPLGAAGWEGPRYKKD